MGFRVLGFRVLGEQRPLGTSLRGFLGFGSSGSEFGDSGFRGFGVFEANNGPLAAFLGSGFVCLCRLQVSRFCGLGSLGLRGFRDYGLGQASGLSSNLGCRFSGFRSFLGGSVAG